MRPVAKTLRDAASAPGNRAWGALLADLDPDPRGERPTSDAGGSLERAWRLVQLADTLLTNSEAREGVVYTPRRLAQALAALIPVGSTATLDPCCGKGALLLAAFERLRQLEAATAPHHHLGRLWGLDVDPLSVATTRVILALAAGLPALSESEGEAAAAVLRRQIQVADALFALPFDGPAGGFPALIANPPYRRAARRVREDLSRRYSSALGAFDLFVPFIERSLELLAEGGRAVLVTSNKFLSADYGRGLRQLLAQQHLEMVFDLTEDRTFEAFIDAAITVVTRAEPQSTVFARAKRPLLALSQEVFETFALARGLEREDEWVVAEHLCEPLWGSTPRAPWKLGVLGRNRLIAARMRAFGLTLGDLFPLRTGVMGFDYHAVVSEIVDGPLEAGERAVATNSVLQPCRSLWGCTPVKLAKRPLNQPKLTTKPKALSAAAWRWSGEPKLVIPGVKSQLMAFYDADGTLAPLVAVHGAAMNEAAGYSLAALLCSRPIRWLFEREQRGAQIPRGSKRFSVQALGRIPMPCPLESVIEALQPVGRALHAAPEDPDLWFALDQRALALFGLTSLDIPED